MLVRRHDRRARDRRRTADAPRRDAKARDGARPRRALANARRRRDARARDETKGKKKGEARRRERLFGTNARARGAGRRAGRRARDARGGEETR